MAHWYTADLHLGHTRALKLFNRPFASTEAMTEKLLYTLKEMIAPDDDLWIIGDFSFGKNQDGEQLRTWFDRLPGRRHLIIGNHDSALVRDLPWASQHDIFQLVDRGVELTLCHYPMIAFPRSGNGALQLFGHVHEQWPGSRNSINVAVDQWDFRPVQVDAILDRAARLAHNKHYEDVEFGGADRVPQPPLTPPQDGA